MALLVRNPSSTPITETALNFDFANATGPVLPVDGPGGLRPLISPENPWDPASAAQFQAVGAAQDAELLRLNGPTGTRPIVGGQEAPPGDFVWDASYNNGAGAWRDKAGNVWALGPEGNPNYVIEKADGTKVAAPPIGSNNPLKDLINVSPGGALVNEIAGKPVFSDAPGGGALSDLGRQLGISGSSGGPSSIDTGAISAASARAAALSDQYEAERRAYRPIEAPQAYAQQIYDTSLADTQAPIPVQLAQAAMAQRQAGINAPTAAVTQAAAPERISAQGIKAVTAVTQAPIGFERLGPTQMGPTSLAEQARLAQTAMAQSATIDPTQQAKFRAGQEGLVSGLQGAIAGTDPSVAAILLRQETERNIANQYALAQAATGQNSALAQRQAAINAAGLNQQAIGQQALLRAQEIATARGQLGSVLDAGRGQDIGLAGQQAGLQQQTALANQGAVNAASATQLGADVQTRLANAGFLNTANMTQAQLQQAIAIANQNAGLDATKTNATLAQQVALANAAAQTNANVQNANNALQAATSNQQYGTQVALANAAAQNQGAQFNAGNQLDAAKTNATLAQQVELANAASGTQVNVANAGAQNAAATQNAQLAQQVALANAASQNQTNQTNATLGTQTNIANAGNATTTNAQNITAQNNLAQNALAGSGQAIQGAVGAASAQAEAQKAANQQEASKLAAASTIAASLLSDRRAKKDIKAGDLDVAAFLRDLKAYNFKYKDPDAPGAAPGERTGIMVQDLERNRLGRSLVRETAAGKAIDVNQATGAALAALGELNRRVEKVEARG